MCWQAGGTNKQADEEVACMLGMTIRSGINTDFLFNHLLYIHVTLT